MMNITQKYKVTLMGQSYTIISDELEQDILEAAKLVEKAMREATVQSAVSDNNKITLLAALNLALRAAQVERKMFENIGHQSKLIDLIAEVNF